MDVDGMQNVQLSHRGHEPRGKYALCFLAADMEVPMNVGSVFRIADALGVEKIYLTGSSVVPPHPKIRKTSRSTENYVPFAYAADAMSVVEELKGQGYLIVSLEVTSRSIDLGEFRVPPDTKICLILGAENAGVSQALLDISDQTLHIPMVGVNSSMNVATAGSIATYAITRMLKNKL